MKHLNTCLLTALLASALSAQTINVPSDGSDGVFAPTSDITVDLSLAVTGNWDANNAANAGVGIYDPDEWAVVFKYSSVNIPDGVTVTFQNHPSGAPVMWLVEGNVVIDGEVNLRGSDGSTNAISSLSPTEAGPGGFRGGAFGPEGLGAGYGPGGVNGDGEYRSTYGNPQILPLIGGQGGTMDDFDPGSGGAGGGALLVATGGSILLNGLIDCEGGSGGGSFSDYSGSGGAIRLIGSDVSGSGALSAIGGVDADVGRIRIEANSLSTELQIAPETVAVTPVEFPILFPPDDALTVQILTVDGKDAPSDPTAPLAGTSDVAIQENGVVQVVLETTNFPTSGVVEVRAAPKFSDAAWVTASFSDGDFLSARWVANITFRPGFTALQARATVP